MVPKRTTFGRLTSLSTVLAFALVSLCPPHLEAADVKVPAGTPVMLRTAQAISPQNVKAGDPVSFTVADDVVVDGKVVIKAGSQAKGEVVKAEKRGILGKPDRVSVQITSVTAVDGKTLPVSAAKAAEGEDKMVLGIILTLICLPLLFIKGGEAEIGAGTTVQAMTTGLAEVRVADDPATTSKPAEEASKQESPTETR